MICNQCTQRIWVQFIGKMCHRETFLSLKRYFVHEFDVKIILFGLRVIRVYIAPVYVALSVYRIFSDFISRRDLKF